MLLIEDSDIYEKRPLCYSDLLTKLKKLKQLEMMASKFLLKSDFYEYRFPAVCLQFSVIICI